MTQKSFDETKLNGIICMAAGWLALALGAITCLGPAFDIYVWDKHARAYWTLWEQLELGLTLCAFGYVMLRFGKFLLGPERKERE